MTGWTLSIAVAVLASPHAELAHAGDSFREPIRAIRAVGPDGKGAREAALAWRELASADVSQLPILLAGMDGASALSRNWLRSAMDDLLVRARRDGKPLPVADLETFLHNKGHDPQARRFAFELIVETDKTAADRLLPGMIDDPSPELRFDAVARVIDQAEKADLSEKKEESGRLFRQALASARDKEQISKIARRLKDLGQPVDLAAHLGLITTWKLVGPFPNPKKQGIDNAYPPERSVDLSAAYDGDTGKVRWKDCTTKQQYGIVDLNSEIGPRPTGVAYALSDFMSAAEKEVDIRIGCFTPFKLWVNGELVLARGDAYTGMSLDHYVAKAHLKPGKNTLLLKIAKDEPPPGSPKDWRFQLRVSDASGAGILSAERNGQERKTGRQGDREKGRQGDTETRACKGSDAEEEVRQ
jgi:hypothetical protein